MYLKVKVKNIACEVKKMHYTLLLQNAIKQTVSI